LIRNYYSKSLLMVRDNHAEKNEKFKSTVGVKQGGPASPRLFNGLINILILIVVNSSMTYSMKRMPHGILVYADDTTIICDSLHKLNLTIKLVERFCSEYDVTINVKKTKWLRFGPKYSAETEAVTLLNQTVEQVEEFKFLGVTIQGDSGYASHIKKRTQMYMQAISEINGLGFNDSKLLVKIKSLLYVSLARSKLMYGLEALKVNEKDTKNLLTKLESNVIKRCNSLGWNSKSTALLYAMEITPISLHIIKRKIGYIIQLVRNQATNTIISNGIHKSLDDVIEYIGINDAHRETGAIRYGGLLLAACTSKLESIKVEETRLKGLPLVKALRHLLNTRNKENDATIKYLLDPRRCKRG